MQGGWSYSPIWYTKHVCIRNDTRTRLDTFILQANRHTVNIGVSKSSAIWKVKTRKGTGARRRAWGEAFFTTTTRNYTKACKIISVFLPLPFFSIDVFNGVLNHRCKKRFLFFYKSLKNVFLCFFLFSMFSLFCAFLMSCFCCC